MKHPQRIIFILLFLFLLSQFVGIALIKHYETNKLPFALERPDVTEKGAAFTIALMIGVATAIVLIFARFRLSKLWKVWFFLASGLVIGVSIAVFLQETLALLISYVFAFFKVFKRNIIIHNLTEVFAYGALAVLFSPLLNAFWATMLLLAVSIYDIWAVWGTKHMVKLAKFQEKAQVFAGFFIPYGKKTAILGGGDIAFPLIFIGTLYTTFGLKTFIMPIFVTAALGGLFLISKKKRYYPAMPFLTIGCLVGYGVLLLF